MISRHLLRCGYRLHAFGSAAELLARAAEFEPRPDLLLTDVVIPGMNGVELARAVAQLWPGTRVLFISGYAVDVAISAMTSITDEMLISKPF
ncbi:MAG: response regulator [Kofleriaceae bacterium]